MAAVLVLLEVLLVQVTEVHAVSTIKAEDAVEDLCHKPDIQVHNLSFLI